MSQRRIWHIAASLTFTLLLIITLYAGKDPPKEPRWLPKRHINIGDINIYTPEYDTQIGRSRAEQADQHLPILHDEQINAYIKGLALNINKHSDSPFSFQIKIINTSGTSNAMTFPGGYCYIYRGLIELTKNEDELAAIIGHEIGHVAARHETEELSVGLHLSDSPVLPWLNAENEADCLGVRYAYYSGHDPVAALTLLEHISKQEFINIGLGLNPHPFLKNRIANMKDCLARLPISEKAIPNKIPYRLMRQKLANIKSQSLTPDMGSFLDFASENIPKKPQQAIPRKKHYKNQRHSL